MSGWEFFSMCYPQNYYVSVCMAVYKKKKIDRLKLMFPEGLFYEDNYFTFMFITQAESVTYLPKKLYQRRYRDNSITTSMYSEKKFTDYIKVVLLIWDEIIQKKSTVSSDQKQLLLRFTSDQCRVIMDNYNLCVEQDIALGNMEKNCFCRIAEAYERLLDQYGIDNSINNPVVVNRVLENLRQIALYCPENKSCVEQIIKDITKKRNYFYKQLLSELPLNIEKCRVGVFGTGKHTDGMLTLYEKLVGKIECDLIFIDSYIENGNYMNRKVVNYQCIDKSFDLIIISSFLYEREMREKVWEVNKEVPIYTFYEVLKTDIFSEFSLA